MSVQNATAFLEKVDADSALKERINALGTGASLDDVLDIAATNGFNFNVDELVAAGKTRAEANGMNAELSEEDLEGVAGGLSGVTIHISRSSVYVTAW